MYQKLSEEKKEKQRQYGLEQGKNLPGHEKRRLLEYRRKYGIRFLQQLFKSPIKCLNLDQASNLFRL